MCDWVLALVEFSYNDSPNRIKGYSPFYILYGMHPHEVHELRDLGQQERWSANGEYFAKAMNDLHEQVKMKLQDNNLKYKQ